MVFHGREARLPKNSLRAKVAGRLCSVFKFLAAPLNRGRILNENKGAIMANSSAYVAYLAAAHAQKSLSAIITLLGQQEKLEISGPALAHVLRDVLFDVDGAVDELEHLK